MIAKFPSSLVIKFSFVALVDFLIYKAKKTTAFIDVVAIEKSLELNVIATWRRIEQNENRKKHKIPISIYKSTLEPSSVGFFPS